MRKTPEHAERHGEWCADPRRVHRAHVLWDEGKLTASQIAVAVGLGAHQKGAILGYARRNGWAERKHFALPAGHWKTNPEKMAKARAMFDDGHSHKEIAEAFNTTEGAIAGLQKRHKWGARERWFLSRQRAMRKFPVVDPEPEPEAPDPPPAAVPVEVMQTEVTPAEPAPPDLPLAAPPPPPPPARNCQWITSAGKPWRFCEAVASLGTPYCAEHRAVAYAGRSRREAA